jgi:hypothetical protein
MIMNKFLAVVFLLAGLSPVLVVSAWKGANGLVPVNEQIILSSGLAKTISFATPISAQYDILITINYPNSDRQVVCKTGAKNFPSFGCLPSNTELNVAWTLNDASGRQEAGTSDDQTWGSASNYRFIRQVGTFRGNKGSLYRLRLSVRENANDLNSRDPRLLVQVSPGYLEGEVGFAMWGMLFASLCFGLSLILWIRSRKPREVNNILLPR